MQTVAHSARETVEVVDGVHLTPLVSGEQASIQHFHVESGAEIPAHALESEQLGYVLKGTLTVRVDGEQRLVGRGDSYYVPAGVTRSAVNGDEKPVDGIDVFAPPRDGVEW